MERDDDLLTQTTCPLEDLNYGEELQLDHEPKVESNNTLLYLLVMAVMLVMLMALLFAATESHAESFKVGERTGFDGYYCTTITAADNVFAVETEAKMVERSQQERHCSMAIGNIEVVRQVKVCHIEGHLFFLVEVRTGTKYNYVVSKIGVGREA